VTLTLLARSLHVLGAIVWIGGMLFIALVLVPVVRRLEPLERARLVQAIGLRFRTVGWIVVHDFVLGPRAGAPGADPRLRGRASWLARANVLVVLAVVVLGLALRG
jgi:uncharacterized membrane protein